MRTSKIYSLSNFQILNTALVTIVTRLYITSPGHVYFITEGLYILTPVTYFFFSPSPSGNHQSVLCIYELVSFVFISV